MCLSKTIEQRTIDYKTSDLFIGRVGVMAGFNCPNDRGTAYVRVSGLRDFRGDIDGTFSANGNEYKVDMDLDQNRVSPPKLHKAEKIVGGGAAHKRKEPR